VVEALRLPVERDAGWLRAYIDRRNRHDPNGPQTSLDDTGLQQARAQLTARLDDLAASLYRSVEREEPGAIEFQWDQAGKLVANTVIRAGFSYIPVLGQISAAVTKANEGLGEATYADKLFDLFQRERARIYREQVQSLEQFHQGLTELVQELVTALDRRLVVFIDDLDRCLPEQAIGVLEALKVFLDIRGCVFVLGVDREIIERGIRVRYKEFALSDAATGVLPSAERNSLQKATIGGFPVAERDYLEKIVQVPFALPPLAPDAIRAFLSGRLPSVPGLTADEPAQVAALMTAGLLRNPRKVKRSFNIFRLHLTLDRAHGRRTPAGLIAKLTVIQSSFADLYEHIADDPTLLRSIEQIVCGTPGAGAIAQELREAVGQSDPRLNDMLFQAPFFTELNDDTLRELVYRSRITDEGAGAGAGAA
jgi:hypothetical protein